MFSLNTGDSLLLMADKGQGIALQPFSYMETLWNAVNNVKNKFFREARAYFRTYWKKRSREKHDN